MSLPALQRVMAKPEPQEHDAQLTAYRCLLDNARAMLQAAREERWDDLSILDGERQECFAKVVEIDLVSTKPANIAACTELIQSILECDEQTKALVKAWQSEMAEVLGTMDNSRKLADAYRSG
jgi:hypothetical protein